MDAVHEGIKDGGQSERGGIPLENLYTPRQVADYFHVSLSTVYLWIGQDILPVTYVGSERRISHSGLVDFIKASQQRAAERRGVQGGGRRGGRRSAVEKTETRELAAA